MIFTDNLEDMWLIKSSNLAGYVLEENDEIFQSLKKDRKEEKMPKISKIIKKKKVKFNENVSIIKEGKIVSILV